MMSSSLFCRADVGIFTSMLMMRASRVVSNAVPSPPKTPFRALFIELMSDAVSRLLASPATAVLTPTTVPMKPRIGSAQMNAFSSV